jgi:hypothetical protein
LDTPAPRILRRHHPQQEHNGKPITTPSCGDGGEVLLDRRILEVLAERLDIRGDVERLDIDGMSFWGGASGPHRRHEWTGSQDGDYFLQIVGEHMDAPIAKRSGA